MVLQKHWPAATCIHVCHVLQSMPLTPHSTWLHIFYAPPKKHACNRHSHTPLAAVGSGQLQVGSAAMSPKSAPVQRAHRPCPSPPPHWLLPLEQWMTLTAGVHEFIYKGLGALPCPQCFSLHSHNILTAPARQHFSLQVCSQQGFLRNNPSTP